ncbi:hypothetical protein WME79_15165 [Sorangium sp. So ce726]|uniref:hypothetical protein n=1 Tax=Sorangium sp. So ce726 TaxID=3133319 RepID=UPI003F630C9B
MFKRSYAFHCARNLLSPATIAVVALLSPSAFATTSAVDVYLNSVYQSTISTTTIQGLSTYGTYNYSGVTNAPANQYYTAEGATLGEILEQVSALTGNLSSITMVVVHSPVGPNFTRTFCSPQSQLFTDRNYYPDLSNSAVYSEVPAILAALSKPRDSGTLSSTDALRLFFGHLSTTERNIPYFTKEVDEIDVYTGETGCSGGYGYL